MQRPWRPLQPPGPSPRTVQVVDDWEPPPQGRHSVAHGRGPHPTARRTASPHSEGVPAVAAANSSLGDASAPPPPPPWSGSPGRTDWCWAPGWRLHPRSPGAARPPLPPQPWGEEPSKEGRGRRVRGPEGPVCWATRRPRPHSRRGSSCPFVYTGTSGSRLQGCGPPPRSADPSPSPGSPSRVTRHQAAALSPLCREPCGPHVRVHTLLPKFPRARPPRPPAPGQLGDSPAPTHAALVQTGYQNNHI